ncbi:hypothetical protein LDL08_18835 [Nonomuraea glycinis]|uniref:Uncharacterized protein n=1 Tax=Nonomuraea glycinis TaxID=2047744 RepID=A0A918AA26_9ACTN|nr:hypothetical protein [Nonomuraea glycinis]MCA2178249.1 hypothetical protein [Nonomuraea glycinis]GGP12649.1 hypothetical protein GCM10012278_61290 [Nonomuraea glycinis]
MNLRVGDLVEVRGEEEILATLDERGELESLPFMPEMLRFCGRRMTVHKVAHKLCDTISRSGMRRMERAVHLTGARCGGEAHGGCQTACSLYWKEAWLKRVDPDTPEPTAEPAAEPAAEPIPQPAPEPERRLLPLLEVNTRSGVDTYSCQATELLRAAPACLPFRDVRQYVTDVRTGNAGTLQVARTFLVGLFNRFQDLSKKVLPRRLWIRKGLRWGFVEGRAGRMTPTAELGLKPGELVRIKSKDEILATLNDDLLNRGLGFEEEMARYCGRTARVRARVERCLDEKTGLLLSMKSPCIVLDDLVCEGVYNANCPREFVPFWREIWLERVE